MKKYFALVLCAFFLFGCSKTGDKATVIQVGKDKMNLSMLQKRFSDAPITLQGYLNTESGKKQFLDLIVRERIVVEAAKQAGYEKKKEYQESLKAFKEEQEKQFKEYKENQLVENYVKDLQKNTINVTDEDTKKYYDEHIADYQRPLEIKARHILLSTKADAQKVMEMLKKGGNFEKLAKEVSIDPISAGRGGEIGPFTKGDLIPEFEKAVFPMKINEVSDIVETQFGFHIIKKISEKVLPAKSYDQVKDEIKKLQEKSKFDAWLEVSKNKFGTKVDYSALSKLAALQLQEPEAKEEQPAQARKAIKK